VLSQTPNHLYFNGSEYTGNSDIKIIFVIYEDYTLPAGKIENGQVKLDLPPTIESQYLNPITVPPGFSLTGSGVSSADVYLKATMEGINGMSCYLRLLKGEAGTSAKEKAEARFGYASGNAKISGTSKNGDDTFTIDVNVSKGWNILWITGKCSDDDVCTIVQTTTLPSGDSEWHCW
jgi:hypothetical protein